MGIFSPNDDWLTSETVLPLPALRFRFVLFHWSWNQRNLTFGEGDIGTHRLLYPMSLACGKVSSPLHLSPGRQLWFPELLLRSSGPAEALASIISEVLEQCWYYIIFVSRYQFSSLVNEEMCSSNIERFQRWMITLMTTANFISYRVGEGNGISYVFITKHLDKQYKMTDDIVPLGSRRMNMKVQQSEK